MTGSASRTHVELSKQSAVREDLYPELEGHGLPALLQRGLERIGSALTVDRRDDLPQGFPAFAQVHAPGRLSQVYLAAGERLFLVDFLGQGCSACEGADSQRRTRRLSLDFWIAGLSNSMALAASFPFVSVAEDAEAFESGQATQRAWDTYLQRAPTDFPELVVFIRLAYETPQLRQLFPFTSLSRLCFSRCTGYPYTEDCPVVGCTPEGKHTVSIPGRSLPASGLTADEALELVLRSLPESVGPAVDGTAEDMSR